MVGDRSVIISLCPYGDKGRDPSLLGKLLRSVPGLFCGVSTAWYPGPPCPEAYSTSSVLVYWFDLEGRVYLKGLSSPRWDPLRPHSCLEESEVVSVISGIVTLFVSLPMSTNWSLTYCPQLSPPFPLSHPTPFTVNSLYTFRKRDKDTKEERVGRYHHTYSGVMSVSTV